MLRVKILASAVPLVVAGMVAGGELLPSDQPCIALGAASLQIAAAPWQGQLHVSFTDDPAAATVRVQLVDDATIADFAVIDDVRTADDASCRATAATTFVEIAERAASADPVIYLTHDGGADYRVFVRSRSFTARDAAALVVSARRNARLADPAT
jgi:hypothetical protein